MKFLKRLFASIVLLIAVLLLVALFLPASAHVERSINIQATPPEVFALVNDFRQFNRWSPWARQDPKTRYIYDGPESGRGARMSWQSDDPAVGSGNQEITLSEPPRRVEVQLDFGAQGVATAYYDLQPDGSGTRLTWGFDTEFGYDLPGRYFGLLFERMLGPYYEQGLAGIKQIAESGG